MVRKRWKRPVLEYQKSIHLPSSMPRFEPTPTRVLTKPATVSPLNLASTRLLATTRRAVTFRECVHERQYTGCDRIDQ